MHDNEDGPMLAGQSEQGYAEAEYAAKVRHDAARMVKRAAERGLFGGQSRPPDPLEEQVQAWRLYGAFLETARLCRDAFQNAKLDNPAALGAALEMLGAKD